MQYIEYKFTLKQTYHSTHSRNQTLSLISLSLSKTHQESSLLLASIVIYILLLSYLLRSMVLNSFLLIFSIANKQLHIRTAHNVA